MTWRPISTSGVPYSFSVSQGDVTMAGSVVTAALSSGPTWGIELGDGTADYSIRVTVESYDSQDAFDEDPSEFRFTVVGGAETTVVNANTGSTTEFDPNPITGTGRLVEYSPGSGIETVRTESYTMLVELDVTSSPRIKPILQTFRGYMEADNAFTTWVRTEEGQADLSEATVTIKVRPYSRPGRQVATLTATADATGRVDFDIPALTTTQQLAPGLYRLELVAEQGETIQVIQVGLLDLA